MVHKLLIPILLTFAFMIRAAQAQNETCNGSLPFCTGMELTYAAGTDGIAEPGAYYGCLSTQNAPAWFHMVVENPGNITIYMHSSPLVDIDFICWGPFTDPLTPCVAGLTAGKTVDCSYSPNPTEFCDISNAQPGSYYILMITNYSQQPTQITFEQSSGSGSLDCDLVTGLVPAFSALPLEGTAPLTVQFTDESVGHPVSYKWDFQNDGTYDAFDPDPVFTFQDPGLFSVRLWVMNEYEADSITYTDYILVDTTTGITDLFPLSGPKLIIYPNPAKDKLYIDYTLMKEMPESVEIIFASGLIILQTDFVKYSDRIIYLDINEYPPGIYLVRTYLKNKVMNNSVIIHN
jgi:hypothetical protein